MLPLNGLIFLASHFIQICLKYSLPNSLAVVKLLLQLLSYVVQSSTGLVKDDTKTLSDLKVTNNAKMMVIGSTVKDIMAVNIPPSAKALKEESTVTGMEIYRSSVGPLLGLFYHRLF
jgi:hypothetical protein